jgi:hypothetical protein
LFGYDLLDALVALAVIIAADIEEVMVLPVIPSNDLSFGDLFGLYRWTF